MEADDVAIQNVLDWKEKDKREIQSASRRAENTIMHFFQFFDIFFHFFQNYINFSAAFLRSTRMRPPDLVCGWLFLFFVCPVDDLARTF